MKRFIVFALACLFLLAISAPALAQEEAAAADIRIGILPVMNVYPFYAHPLGYFEEAGVSIEMVPVFSAQALREGLAAGELDGFQADLITTLVLLEEGHDVRLARHVGMGSPPLFGILTHEASGIMSAAELAGARIGISEQTVVQYVTDLMLASAGVDPGEVEYVNIPLIIERQEMLSAGEIDAATLPQPFYALAEQAGAAVLIDDAVLDYVPEAIGFRAEALAEKGDQVRAFFSAYERAVVGINAHETFEDGLAWVGEEIRGALQATFEGGSERVLELLNLLRAAGIWPALTEARVPTAEEYAHAQEWALAAGLVSEARAYEDVVDGSYLPEMMSDDEMADDGDAGDGDE